MRNTLLLFTTFFAFVCGGFAQPSYPQSQAETYSEAQLPTSQQPADNGQANKTKPKILYQEKAPHTDLARQHGVHGTVILSCIFSATGKVSDIQVIKGLPYGLTEKATEAAAKIKFVPATVNGEPTSVRMFLEFTFEILGVDVDSVVRILSFDFPFLTTETSSLLGKTFCQKSPTAAVLVQWVIQCEALGIGKLSLNEQNELLQLYKDAIAALPPTDKELYEVLLIKSQNNKLTGNDLERAFAYKNQGLTNLPPEKKKRYTELHNKAIRLGFAEFIKK